MVRIMRWLAILALALPLAEACGGSSPTSPSSSDALTEQIATEHYVFHYARGDSVDTAWQEAFHAWAVAQLGVTPPRITYNKYRDRAHMSALTGHASNGFAELPLNTLHTIWRSEAHEAVHVIAASWGFPVALFVEGLAVAHVTNPSAGDFVPRWSGTPIHEAARQLRATGQLIPIASIAETAAFRARNQGVTYPQSGSFVRFLIDADGIGAMRRLFASMPGEAPLATVRSAFQNVYGYTLEEAEARWLRFLDGA
jgi:hypothetical protein